MSGSTNLPALIPDQQISLSEAGGLIRFVDEKRAMEPIQIIEFIAENGLMPPELLFALHTEMIALIAELRANAQAAVGKKITLVEGLEEASRELVEAFTKDHSQRIQTVMALSSDAMLYLSLLAEIVASKDIAGTKNADLEKGLKGILELEEGHYKIMGEVAVRASSMLSADGTEWIANPIDRHTQRPQLGYIKKSGWQKHPTEADIQRVKEWLLETFPTLHFIVHNSMENIEISLSGQKKVEKK